MESTQGTRVHGTIPVPSTSSVLVIAGTKE